MRWSTLFIPTLRESPSEADSTGHRLLMRAGYIRQVAAGVYSYLLLGQRSLHKIQRIVREEMNAIEGQEIFMPALHAAQVVMPSIAAGELRSYKQLPQIWYQIQTTFDEEPKPGSALTRVRQSIVGESFSFDLDKSSFDATFRKHREAYRRIFDRCRVEQLSIEAASGDQFVSASDAGDEVLARCPQCGYTAKLASAVSIEDDARAADPEGNFAPEEFHTPGMKTIADVAAFTHLPESSQMKSLVLVADDTPVLVIMRGDHQLSETKLATAVGARDLRPAQLNEIVAWFGASAGSLGPVGVKTMRILADRALEGRRNMISGANRDDYHLKNVTPGEDFEAEFLDLRQAMAGDRCASCGASLQISKGVVLGTFQKLDNTGSHAAAVRVLNESGAEVASVVGSYRLAIERVLACAAEQHHDGEGLALPASIAPFALVITAVNCRDGLQREAADLLYARCSELGIETVLDDRDERAGVKFKDADLIGIPYRITLGKKLGQGIVELSDRRTRASEDLLLHDVAAQVAGRLNAVPL